MTLIRHCLTRSLSTSLLLVTLTAYGLELKAPLTLDDKADCGAQTASVLAVESDAVASYVDKTVVLRATPYCRVSRSGKYHLKDVTVR
jgi:hypothetical protein